MVAVVNIRPLLRACCSIQSSYFGLPFYTQVRTDCFLLDTSLKLRYAHKHDNLGFSSVPLKVNVAEEMKMEVLHAKNLSFSKITASRALP